MIEAKLIGGPLNGSVRIVSDLDARLDPVVIELYCLLSLKAESAPTALAVKIFYSRIANTSSYVFIGENRYA